MELITYFTAGPKEARAWTIRRVHPHRKRRALFTPILSADLFAPKPSAMKIIPRLNGEQGARDAGRLRQEGKDYVVQDGDVMLFRFNV